VGGTGLEPVTSCVSNKISAHKCLPFKPLYALFLHKYRFHTGDTLVGHCLYTKDLNKTDVEMTLSSKGKR
jgi:hypothetical protein